MNEYIDVRGVYPIYVCGPKAIRLPYDFNRNWTIMEARSYAWMLKMNERNETH